MVSYCFTRILALVDSFDMILKRWFWALDSRGLPALLGVDAFSNAVRMGRCWLLKRVDCRAVVLANYVNTFRKARLPLSFVVPSLVEDFLVIFFLDVDDDSLLYISSC